MVAAPLVVRDASILMPLRGLVLPVPAMRVSVWSDLTDTTRRAFVPRLFVQLYVRSPVSTLMQQLQDEEGVTT